MGLKKLMNLFFMVTLIFLKKTESNRYEKDPLMSVDLAVKSYHSPYIRRNYGWGMGTSEVPKHLFEKCVKCLYLWQEV